MKNRSFLALLVACSALPLTALAETPTATVSAPATRVYIGVFLHDVTSFDQRSGTYDVDLDVWAKWLGRFDPKSIRLHNQAGSVTNEDLGAESDGEWHSRRWRLHGTLRGEFPLHRFPFDTQTLSVVFELPERAAALTPDLAGSGMSERFSITGWDYDAHFTPHISRVVYTTDLGQLANEGGSTAARRVRFDVHLRRPTVTIAVKLFLPLLLLMFISVMALFLGAELVDPRAAIGVTVLLACFAFQFTIGGTIPDVAYLTVVDSLFIIAYAMTTTALVESIAVYWIHKNGNDRRALQIDRFFRVFIPLATIVASVWVLPPAIADDVATVAPYPRVTREATARDVVRIGTLAVTSPTAGPLRMAVRSGLTKALPNGERIGLLAEEAPSVSNDMMRFLANGRLEVHWRLREGLRWSDGRALTSDDFRFALEVSPNEHIVKVETPDARTLVLTYDDVLAEALDGITPLPRHELGEAAEGDGGFDAVREAQRARIVVSSGPYRITKFEPNRRVVAEPNPHYVGARPGIRRVEVLGFEDDDALLAAFRAGEVDIVMPNTLGPDAMRELAVSMPDVTLERAAEDLVALSPDFAVPLFANIEVRRAILMAIDRQRIESESGGRSGTIAHTPIAGLAVTDADATPYDPARARALLESAGAIGQTVILSHTDRRVDAQIAASIAEALRLVGLVVEVRALPAGGGAGRNRAHGGLLLTTIRADEESDLRRYWNLKRTAGRFSDTDRNPAYDDTQANLTARFTHAIYVERRRQLRERNAIAVSHRLPILPLFFSTERIAATPLLDGWEEGARFGENLASWHFRAR
jgi:ABC-type transport system substrate-binding protein